MQTSIRNQLLDKGTGMTTLSHRAPHVKGILEKNRSKRVDSDDED